MRRSGRSFAKAKSISSAAALIGASWNVLLVKGGVGLLKKMAVSLAEFEELIGEDDIYVDKAKFYLLLS